MSAELLPIAVTVSVAAVFEITTAEGTDREILARLMSARIKPAVFETLADDELLVAQSRADIAGALVWRLSSDLTAFVWCPVVDACFQMHADEIQRRLMDELKRRTDSANAWFAQCLLQPSSLRDQNVMRDSGFKHIALLRSLCWKPGPNQPPRSGDASLSIHEYNADSDRHRLIQLLEATWVASLDCPILNGHRTGAEAVAAHDTGDTSRWRIFRLDDRDVGLALVSMGQSALALDYMGVVPGVRGSRIGRQIVQYVVQTADTKGLSVRLSVDTANEPAVHIYESLGFQTVRYLDVFGRFHPNRIR